MRTILLAAAGGAIESALRHLVTIGAAKLLGAGFPYGTLAVNIAGSFLMGLLIALRAQKLDIPRDGQLFLATGILGGFTTFSAFSLDVAVLMERGDAVPALIYVAASVGFSILALFAGLYLVRSWLM